MPSCETLTLCATVLLFISASADAQQISGEYVETRSADVYNGQCFANGEVNLVGNVGYSCLACAGAEVGTTCRSRA
jgi:hypothetical protein